MEEPEDARDADFEQASAKLNEGLKTCRSMVRSYRHALAAELAPAEPADAAAATEPPPSGSEC